MTLTLNSDRSNVRWKPEIHLSGSFSVKEYAKSFNNFVPKEHFFYYLFCHNHLLFIPFFTYLETILMIVFAGFWYIFPYIGYEGF